MLCMQRPTFNPQHYRISQTLTDTTPEPRAESIPCTCTGVTPKPKNEKKKKDLLVVFWMGHYTDTYDVMGGVFCV